LKKRPEVTGRKKSRSPGHVHKGDIKRESYDWADFMLEDDDE
jgi:hypothetical protein